MKRIAMCCDGTWNRPDQLDEGVPAPTNVLRLYDAILPVGHAGVQQLRFYEQGVGTHGWLDRFTGGALGIGLAHNVRAAYETIVEHYEDGDELYLFGFSRGAYTARSLAGLIRNSGIVRDSAMIGAADALYRRRDDASKPAAPEAEEFRRRHSWSPRIHFIGVWDTVGALGIPGKLNFIARRRFSFHDVELSSWVDHACHALAIDEQRKPFAPTLWHIQEPKPGAPPQHVEQMWFAGVHSNVGGGYKDACLANHALLWIAAQAETAGLALNQAYLRVAAQMDCPGVLRNSMTLMYRAFGPFPRPIMLHPVRTNEALHPSATERYQSDESYRPRNWPRS